MAILHNNITYFADLGIDFYDLLNLLEEKETIHHVIIEMKGCKEPHKSKYVTTLAFLLENKGINVR